MCKVDIDLYRLFETIWQEKWINKTFLAVGWLGIPLECHFGLLLELCVITINNNKMWNQISKFEQIDWPEKPNYLFKPTSFNFLLPLLIKMENIHLLNIVKIKIRIKIIWSTIKIKVKLKQISMIVVKNWNIQHPNQNLKIKNHLK